jgi:cyclic-di-AMP phosphodiesterase PgpH
MPVPLKNLVKLFSNIFGNTIFRQQLLLLLVFLALILLATFESMPTPNLQVGDICPKDIEAPRNFEYVDEDATREAKRKAARAVGTIFTFEPKAVTQAEQNLNIIFNIAEKINKYNSLNQKYKIEKLNTSLPRTVSVKTLDLLTTVDLNTLSYIKSVVKDILWQVMHQGIRQANLQQAKDMVKNLAKDYNLPPNINNAIVELAQYNLTPNLSPDIKQTIEKQQNRMNEVVPIRNTFYKGQIIIRKGEVVTPAHIEILQVQGKTALTLKKLSGIILFTLLFIFLIVVYLRQQVPHLMQEKYLLLLSIIVVTTVAACKWAMMQTSSPYLAPVATATMLISILLDLRLALLVGALISGYIGIFAALPAPAIVGFITASIAALSVSRVSKRWDLVTSCLVIALANALAVLAFELMSEQDWMQIAVNAALFGGINGLFSGIFAIGILPFLENFFGITTHIKLLEHSNPTEPLLQKLLLEAPGTYHHSIVVANLAETAAQAIGADALLARVGSYFHDIGKIKRPYFFVENQLGGANPHDKLTPSLSTLIITAHAKDGLELAKQHHLPESIINIIASHHGNNIVSYFYHQAKLKNPQVSEQEFRYISPKPHSKEAAIVMLADTVEAATRALSTNNPNKIETLVRQLIKEALADGQLDESELSFKDLTDIANAFIRILTSIYHTRIEYPEKLQLEAIKTEAPGKVNGSQNKKVED